MRQDIIEVSRVIDKYADELDTYEKLYYFIVGYLIAHAHPYNVCEDVAHDILKDGV